MFSTVNLVKSAIDEGVSLALVDGPTAGKTIRRSADRTHELQIAHQATKENGAYDTQRTNVRLTRNFPVAESSDTVKGYVQFSMSIPLNEVTAAEAKELAARLFNFLFGESPGVGCDRYGARYRSSASCRRTLTLRSRYNDVLLL